jgi:hypothetical protein
MKQPESYSESVLRQAEEARAAGKGPRAKPAEPKRDRTWDQDNPPIYLRIRAEDRDRLDAAAEARGLSRDAAARGLLWAALDALEDGRLELELELVTAETTDKRGRRRIKGRQEARPLWRDPTLPEGSE